MVHVCECTYVIHTSHRIMASPAAATQYANLFDNIRLDRVDVCTSIFLSGISVNTKDRLQNTPLHVAAENNAIQVTKYLLSKTGIQKDVQNMV